MEGIYTPFEDTLKSFEVGDTSHYNHYSPSISPFYPHVGEIHRQIRPTWLKLPLPTQALSNFRSIVPKMLPREVESLHRAPWRPSSLHYFGKTPKPNNLNQVFFSGGLGILHDVSPRKPEIKHPKHPTPKGPSTRVPELRCCTLWRFYGILCRPCLSQLNVAGRWGGGAEGVSQSNHFLWIS